MASALDKLISTYPDRRYVHSTSKEEAVQLLQDLIVRVQGMEEFAQFPEGAAGVVLYAMLNKASEICPDGADLGDFRQGYEMILRHAYEEIAPTLLEEPSPKDKPRS